jgi:hypothetical protein
MHSLEEIAHSFIDIAHRIVWSVAATTDKDGRPRTRVLHPVWEWDGTQLTGWVATSPMSAKAAHLSNTPVMSLTYWDDTHDTCTADCDTAWDDTPEQRSASWERFKTAPPPVGYDPAVIPGWDNPQAPAFGVLRLMPRHLRVMPGTLLTTGVGELMTWRREPR